MKRSLEERQRIIVVQLYLQPQHRGADTRPPQLRVSKCAVRLIRWRVCPCCEALPCNASESRILNCCVCSAQSAKLWKLFSERTAQR